MDGGAPTVARNTKGEWCAVVVTLRDDASTTPVTRAYMPIRGVGQNATREQAEAAACRMRERGLL